MKLRNHPTVGIDHWGHESLVVGRPVVQWSERKVELQPLRYYFPKIEEKNQWIRNPFEEDYIKKMKVPSKKKKTR
ncbi:hypothetical protein AVEN_120780-1 [Araneus ventricosus]|uniref:Uncharacterized protein n=1 Tax=Araneus ventricosus TaxID=182803 RepID=A0A4Y2T7E1_ARAVE|nr:hypothetical protein AVEN_120780-1 [Araneus ventricosus]